MNVARVGHIVLIMLSPTLAVAAAIYVPRAVVAIWRSVNKRSNPIVPAGQPIEKLAADLRRLLQSHDALKHSQMLAKRAQRLRAIEAAITDCAIEAAQALAIPAPQRPAHSGLPAPELRRLLRALADAGLALPPTSDLLANDRHH